MQTTLRFRFLGPVAGLVLSSFVWLCPTSGHGQESAGQRAEVSRDAWISAATAEEREGNNGGSPKLKLKGIQEFFLIDFDPLPLRGQRVVRAQLHLHAESPEVLGRVTVSSIVDEWVEGTGNGYDRSAGVSSFLWAKNGELRWSGDGPDITGVTLGNGGSIWGFGDASARDADGWQIIPIDPAVAQARIDGASTGFFVIDDVGNEYQRDGNRIEYRHMPNRFFSSKDSNRARAPFFTLWLETGPTSDIAAKATDKLDPVEPAQLPPLPAAAQTPTPEALAFACRDLFGEPLAALDFHAARGEAIGFFVDGADASSVTLPETPGLDVSVFSTPEIAGHIDPLVPVGFADAPKSDGGAFVEIYVAKDAVPGPHLLQLTVGDRAITAAIDVWDFSLPDQLSFIPQMNCYSLPDDDETPWFRLAHEHRTTLNQLRYGWTGKVDEDAVPGKNTDGSWDWTAWDKRFGPLLDGSAFRGLRRDGVPIEAFYLPLNENWPMDHESHFRGGYWVESAYGDDYWQEFRDISRQFAEHIAERGWSEPMFEFYLNNKVYFKRDRDNRWDACSAPWIFDEPVNTQDFWALRRFGQEFWRGVAEIDGPRFALRADISRPEWQRDLLDGVTTAEVVSGALRTYRERVIDRADRLGNLVYMYGSANPIGTSNVMPAAWCVETWALGGDGVVPWQTIGKKDSWETPDQLALFYPTAGGPIPSVRLKAFRAGQQLTEYLTLYCATSGISRERVGATLLADPALQGLLEKRSETDAGTSRFGAETARALHELRLRLGTWLNEQKPEDRQRWFDPRPAAPDPGMLRERTVVAAPAP